MVESKRLYFPLSVVLAISLSVVIACGKDSPTEPAQQIPARITLSAISVTINAIGESIVLNATVLDRDNTVIQSAAVTWRSSNTDVATVSGSGQVTAVKNGSAQITATAGNASATANLTVSQAATSVTITPSSATLNAIGETVQLEATAFDTGNSAIGGAVITWSSSDPTVATIGADGLVTAVSNGTAQITPASGNASADATITVMQTAGSITVLPAAVTLMAIGETAQLSASVSDNRDMTIADAGVEWSSNDPTVATVNEEGLVTALNNGVTLITVQSGTATASATVTVMQAAGGITLEPSEVTLMAIGETAQLTATVSDSRGELIDDAGVEWSSNDPTVATVNEEGLVTAVANGITLITAQSGTATASATVTVIQAAGGITLEPPEVTLIAIGETAQLTASVVDDRGELIADAEVEWSTSDPAVASVNEEGLVTAVANGITLITAQSGTATASATVTVIQAADGITLEPSEVTLIAIGETAQLTASVVDDRGELIAEAGVEWSTSDPAVATVDGDGLVTAVSNGTAQITATAGNTMADATITVMQTAGSITVLPAAVTLMAIGETAQLTATVSDSRGEPIADAGVEWSTNDPTVASVNEEGLVTALNNGVTLITVQSGTATASATVTVMQTAGSITVLPAAVTLMSIGETAQLTASVVDYRGEPIADAEVEWSSNDPTVATVNEEGLVTAVANGITLITAQSGTATASATVTVIQAAGDITLEPSEVTLIAIRETAQLTATVSDSRGELIDDAEVEWSTSDPAVASVDEEGLVTAVKNGSAQITATAGNASATAYITVSQAATSVTITPSSATLNAIGETAQLEATAFDTGNSAIGGAVFTWSSSDPTVATVGADGLATAVSNGTAQITATSGNATADATITVMQTAGSITVLPAAVTLMAIGETAQLTASVVDYRGEPIADAEVEWSSNDPTVATVNEEGLVTAVANGITLITAQSGTATASATVTVIQAAGGITLEPSEITLIAIRETAQLTATVSDSRGELIADAGVEWSSSDPAVASVDEEGLVTAVKNGSAQITATAGNTSATAYVTVSQAATSVTITPSSATLNAIGETAQLEATAFDTGNSAIGGTVFTWSSSDPAVATVDGDGLVTAVSNGTAQITATSGNATADATITVMQTAGSITVLPAAVTLMAIGETAQLTASVVDDRGVPIADAGVEWSSNDPTVATVNEEGLVTAVANGITLITAQSGTATASATVTVIQAAGGITLEPSEVTLIAIGETAQLTATVSDSRGELIADAGVEWSTGDPAVASVDEEGLVTAVKNGSAQITATAGNASATAYITVSQAATSVTITPSSATLNAIGETAQLEATTFDTGNSAIGGAVFTWSSSDPTVATVGADGLATAVSNGTAQITATSGNATADATITVSQVASSVVITPPSVTLTTKGQTVQLTATVYDANDHPKVDAEVNWSSSDGDVATVSEDGLVTAVSSGSAKIMAASEEASADAMVTVSLPVPVRIDIEPASATLAAVGDTVQLVATAYDANDQEIPDAEITWSSRDPTVATISDDGLVTGVSSGTATITAASGNASTEIEVKVAPAVAEISLSPLSPPTLTALGETLQMTATPRDADGEPVKGASLAWMSSHPRVATVNDSGLVTATGNGGSLITATSGEVKASVIVTISQVAVRIEITPSSPKLSVGNSLQLTANVLDANDGRLRGAPVRWESRNPAVATVSATGLVSAVANGSTRVTATSGSLSGTVRVLVEPGHEGGGDGVIILESDGSLETDREGLVAFYNALDGDNWVDNTNWLTDEPLNTWHGVRYFDDLDRVQWILLQRNGLSGAIPSAISKVDLVQYLYLSNNDITGSIPSSIGDLRYLLLLYLDNTMVSGIPSSISKLEYLAHLLIRSDNLSEAIPTGIAELQNLTLLTLCCDITGSIPSGLGQLAKLGSLKLRGNFTGSIPTSLGGLSNLEILGLYGNLTGTIPSQLGQLSKLFALEISGNQLNGTIPSQLGQLSNLQLLGLNANQLTGSIPSQLGQLSKLLHLHLYENQLSGNIPAGLGQLELLRTLRVEDNQDMTGTLPQQLTNLPPLWEFKVSGTSLCAPVDSTFQAWLDTVRVHDVPDCP